MGSFDPPTDYKEHPMSTRIGESTAEHGKTMEVAELIREKILPILGKAAWVRR
jgi:hypothetical protein